jgi:S-adenosylmethionine:tRNA ribosyltransferase-isomerase
MRVSDFDFDLPARFIAQRPASPRDSARLLAVGAAFRDLAIGDLPDLLDAKDVLVVNDTRVIPARLSGRRARAGKPGPRVEATLIARLPGGPGGETWRALARPARKLDPGDRLEFAPGLSAEVVGKGEAGEVTLGFALADDALAAALEQHGIMPLPPYIKRGPAGEASDRADYQTLFAAKAGAVAAPTAGLHFTPALLAEIEARGVAVRRLTLHVGAGTFLPVKAADTRDHRMHAEWGEISADAVAAVNAARDRGGRVVAVGSTVLRLLEAAAGEDGRLRAFRGETDIFITPGYRFRIVDALLTNFHLPRSTLFMLVAAFAGLERMKAAYAHAKAHGYRFYSYGDACWLERAGDGTAGR